MTSEQRGYQWFRSEKVPFREALVTLAYKERKYGVQHHGHVHVWGPAKPSEDATVGIYLDFPDSAYGRHLKVELPLPAARQLAQQLMVACGDVP